jgi:hypothetical protein
VVVVWEVGGSIRSIEIKPSVIDADHIKRNRVTPFLKMMKNMNGYRCKLWKEEQKFWKQQEST